MSVGDAPWVIKYTSTLKWAVRKYRDFDNLRELAVGDGQRVLNHFLSGRNTLQHIAFKLEVGALSESCHAINHGCVLSKILTGQAWENDELRRDSFNSTFVVGKEFQYWILASLEFPNFSIKAFKSGA